MIDHTHDPGLETWVPGAARHPDFPIQNLALCVFSRTADRPRAGVRIGDYILDLVALAQNDAMADHDRMLLHFAFEPELNAYFALSPAERRRVRHLLSAALSQRPPDASDRSQLLIPVEMATLHLPASVGDYSDFFAGIHHAASAGALKRPDKPLPSNYKHVPLAYHGRTSSIRVSGTPVVRPFGQIVQAGAPAFLPTGQLDHELELGFWIGPGSRLGERISISAAHGHVAGVGLLNDWSARDIQSWETQPLGPFLGKSFLTSVSPYVITAEALAPFQSAAAARGEGDPETLSYLFDRQDQARGAWDIKLEVYLSTSAMRAADSPPVRLAESSARHLYWTPAQMVAHQSSNGCPLRPGDLLGSGTVSAPGPGGEGSLLERSRGGREPLFLPNGECRTFLEDGDEIVLSGWCERDGFRRIGLGEVRGTVFPARPGSESPRAEPSAALEVA